MSSKNFIQNNDPPLLSIGMPVYNGERYVEESIESILQQSFTDFELIISDNASTDSTFSICQRYAKKDRRIHLVRNEINRGAAKNYNTVFEMARGKYFKWAAADDLCAPDYFQHCIDILDREPSFILAYPKTKIIDENTQVISEYDDGLHLKARSASGRFLQFMYSVGECNAVFGVIRSNKLRKTRLIGNYIGSDTCLLAELSLMGGFYEIPEFLFFRRHHSAASSANRDVKSQLQFFDPKLTAHIVLPRWRHFGEHFKSIRRAKIPMTQKVLPTIYLLGSLVLSGRQYTSELALAVKIGFARLGKKSNQMYKLEHKAQ